jgi:hypothetical protein
MNSGKPGNDQVGTTSRRGSRARLGEASGCLRCFEKRVRCILRNGTLHTSEMEGGCEFVRLGCMGCRFIEGGTVVCPCLCSRDGTRRLGPRPWPLWHFMWRFLWLCSRSDYPAVPTAGCGSPLPPPKFWARRAFQPSLHHVSHEQSRTTPLAEYSTSHPTPPQPWRPTA